MRRSKQAFQKFCTFFALLGKKPKFVRIFVRLLDFLMAPFELRCRKIGQLALKAVTQSSSFSQFRFMTAKRYVQEGLLPPPDVPRSKRLGHEISACFQLNYLIISKIFFNNPQWLFLSIKRRKESYP
jgi:hypothetical protein